MHTKSARERRARERERETKPDMEINGSIFTRFEEKKRRREYSLDIARPATGGSSCLLHLRPPRLQRRCREISARFQSKRVFFRPLVSYRRRLPFSDALPPPPLSPVSWISRIESRVAYLRAVGYRHEREREICPRSPRLRKTKTSVHVACEFA